MEDTIATKSEYFQRQNKLISRVLPDSLIVIPNNRPSIRSNDTKYPYRANSYMLYLSDWQEPNSVLTISNLNGERESTLHVKPRDTEKEIWEGRIIGPEGALSDWPVDLSMSISDFNVSLERDLKNHSNVYLISGIDSRTDNLVQELWNKDVLDPCILLDEMRTIKSSSEIESMKKASSIASEAHIKAMSISRPGIGEWEIQAAIESHFTLSRSTNSYNPIVGGGDNSTILHYSSNSDNILGTDLVLVDAGCEVNGYASDITRTWPVSGKFSESQRDIYELVLRAELSAIEACQAGSPWENMHRAASEVLARGLIELGILQCSYEDAIGNNLDGEYRKFFMHGTGHMLGLDVHDVGGGRQGGKKGPMLMPGMIVTIEPGLYFASWRNDINVPKEYSGIGVRIEDDVLITEDGPVVLTEMCPKTIDEIESIVGSAL
ncbi:MAG TPA: M24 family metallopeptidase [Candidatus Thalassarchaeaceae archaeon]|jgi:Xaa-Pro aminopeptidase|nr:Xaa-Pro aminopeptidase [Euryarchaeota archaeon]DAC45173.1 MAG TPA: M24 family metallopeptidase [Candidatus Poseidoniales archaeon]HII34489.1 M24 family metallopeptidase [Candidatus Thalassarchaeaceae archaeon]|tara:strand:+ start:1486 stop:2790 length:1305 start_codon:yes stop_codon:yes gene_type:complete